MSCVYILKSGDICVWHVALDASVAWLITFCKVFFMLQISSLEYFSLQDAESIIQSNLVH